MSCPLLIFLFEPKRRSAAFNGSLNMMLSSLLLLSLLVSTIACGNFEVEYTCTDRETGKPCEELTLMEDPGWPCHKGCATELEFVYTGRKCRANESPYVQSCKFSVYNEDCERHAAGGDEWVTECLEFQPQQVKVHAKGRNGEALFQGNVNEGESFVLTNNGDCIPSMISLEAVEMDGTYEETGTDFRTRLDIAVSDGPVPATHYGAFKLKAQSCHGRGRGAGRPKGKGDKKDDGCFKDVDMRFCVSTDSSPTLDLRYDDMAYNNLDILSEDFCEGEIEINANDQWCRNACSVPFDVCRQRHALSYSFGIHNSYCRKTTAHSKPVIHLSSSL